MAKKKFRVRRVDPPADAAPAEVHLDEVTEAEHAAITKDRAKLMAAVHAELERYLNDPRLVFDDEDDGFPVRSRLSGDYHLSDESYTAHPNGG